MSASLLFSAEKQIYIMDLPMLSTKASTCYTALELLVHTGLFMSGARDTIEDRRCEVYYIRHLPSLIQEDEWLGRKTPAGERSIFPDFFDARTVL